jgi:transposase
VEVLIGVDPHKATNVVAAIDEQGESVGQQTFPATRKGLRTLQRWAKRFPERRWAVEGASGIGRPLAQKLLAAGERVVDVPPKLSSRAYGCSLASLATLAKTIAWTLPSLPSPL